MSRHAQALGYDALILFLVELVLWLASHAADSVFVSREGQKVVKLVEATLSIRPIPIVRFIARQRRRSWSPRAKIGQTSWIASTPNMAAAP